MFLAFKILKNILKYPTQIKKLVNHNEKIRVRVTSFFLSYKTTKSYHLYSIFIGGFFKIQTYRLYLDKFSMNRFGEALI